MSEPSICDECGKNYGASWGDTSGICGRCKNKLDVKPDVIKNLKRANGIVKGSRINKGDKVDILSVIKDTLDYIKYYS